jgi:hypothetical protein|tara:strand:+ start:127 stop:312 length:186 start_codon:yes stop_codon:yes gene_type:complete
MKVFGKKTVIIDCEWELEDQPELEKKLESMNDFELIDYLNNNGNYEETGDDEINFSVDYWE